MLLTGVPSIYQRQRIAHTTSPRPYERDCSPCYANSVRQPEHSYNPQLSASGSRERRLRMVLFRVSPAQNAVNAIEGERGKRIDSE